MLEQITTKNNKKRKSVKLTEKQAICFENYRKQFLTHEDCAEAIGIHKHTIARIIDVKRCSPDTYNKMISLNIIPPHSKG